MIYTDDVRYRYSEYKILYISARINLKLKFKTEFLVLWFGCSQKTALALREDVKNKFKERLKQHATDVKCETLKNIEKTSTVGDDILRQEFEFVKRRNLGEFEEYYSKLIRVYGSGYRKRLDDVGKRNDEEYDGTKTFLRDEYARALDSAGEKFRNEKPVLSDTVVSIVVREPVETQPETVENSFGNPRAVKLDKLERVGERIRFCKREIEIVLNDYAKLMTTAQSNRSAASHVFCVGKTLEKYTKNPTTDELGELMLRDEKCV